ncbi:type 1 glutamine amidotransferase domain-containing protein [Lentzea sp. NPDC060358]|uniref:type 1 glutamine amidotransferase domain-containing protein n=1 Tax=Lentzea sp. NPDC060358 TaxID=3347103 RepID=UPI003653EF67
MRVLMPLPDHDFDVTEVAVPWRLLTDAGHEVVFATERGGTPAQADPLLLTGVLFGQLGAEDEPRRFYAQLLESAAYRAPIAWEAVESADYDGLVLPGGHAPGMRQYLGSTVVQDKVAEFWALDRPVGAICHGPLVLARAGVLSGRRTTCLPKYLERSAFYLTAWRRGRYYRTYPDYVQDEVLAAGAVFERGPVELSRRGTATDDGPAFVVTDGNYVSGRWPGDAYLFARTFEGLLS